MGSGTGGGYLVAEPVGVTHVIVCYSVDFAMNLGFIYGLYFFCRYARINTACLANRAFQHHGAGGNYGITVYHGIVHYDRSHTHQHIVVEGAAMHQGIMSDRHIIPDYGLGFLVGTVDHRTILHIYLVAHPDTVHIATDHGIEPYTAVIAHDHIAHDSGIRSQKTIGTELGEFTVYVQNQGHGAEFCQRYKRVASSRESEASSQ